MLVKKIKKTCPICLKRFQNLKRLDWIKMIPDTENKNMSLIEHKKNLNNKLTIEQLRLKRLSKFEK